jgi:hypothetical protein
VRKTFSYAALAALAIGCTKNEPRLTVNVPAGSFTRVPVGNTTLSLATVPFDVKNIGGATALIQACDARISATVQRRVNDQWQQYSSGVCLANLSSAPVPLREDARQHGDVGIGESGRYRIRVFYTPDAAKPGSKSSASDPFDVH